MTAIKMCGMTRVEDARAAADLGVHAVGLILWPGSPRHVGLDAAARLIAVLPPLVTAVGVFVSPDVDDIVRAVEAGIGLAQIHGVVPVWPEGRPPTRILRALRLCAGDDGALDPPVDAGVAVLLDAHDPHLHGGTGRTVDWARAATVARQRPVVLAGGLTAANVEAAIATVRPYGVDVASGVEDGPGIKAHDRMRQFVDAVRRADTALRSEERR